MPITIQTFGLTLATSFAACIAPDLVAQTSTTTTETQMNTLGLVLSLQLKPLFVVGQMKVTIQLQLL